MAALAACAHEPAGSPAASAPGEPASAERAGRSSGEPARPSLSPEEQARVNEFARAYADFLARAKTVREAVRELSALAQKSGGAVTIVEQRPDAIALARAGRRPLGEGIAIVVVPLDAPHLRLLPAPLEEREHFGMLRTTLHGTLDLKQWLSIPLALHGFIPGKPGLVIGEQPGDPVLVVPDLLPHLAMHAQAERIIEPSNMSVLGSLGGARALGEALAARGVPPDDLATGEFSVVPADAPTFVGADRALLAGYGAGSRALAYGAVRALVDAAPEHGVLVIGVSSLDGASAGRPFVRTAIERSVAASGGDQWAVRGLIAHSLAVIGHAVGGEPGKGIALGPLDDDATPEAQRRLLRGIEHGGGRFQISSTEARGAPARELSTQNLDAIELGVPEMGSQAPLPVISAFDLYQGYRACKGLFELP